MKLYSLVGSFVKDEGTGALRKKLTVHSFTLTFTEQSLTFYTIKLEDKDGWVKALKKAIGYSNLNDFYSIGVWLVLLKGIEEAGEGEVRSGV